MPEVSPWTTRHTDEEILALAKLHASTPQAFDPESSEYIRHVELRPRIAQAVIAHPPSVPGGNRSSGL